ncbi:MAG TPA: hypothetical protein VKA95_14735 [Nitrososphaeraceae archaeon]|nr:hypothetical protein [Nitrososphaeraceae archaeon]
MNVENAPSFVATLGGGFFASFLIGYFTKENFEHYSERLDRMYYNVLLTRNSITIQGSSNVPMMEKRR